jgi:hypothetical protein
MLVTGINARGVLTEKLGSSTEHINTEGFKANKTTQNIDGSCFEEKILCNLYSRL